MDLLDDDDDVPPVVQRQPAPPRTQQPNLVGRTAAPTQLAPSSTKQVLAQLSASRQVSLEIKVLFHELKELGVNVRRQTLSLLGAKPLLDLNNLESYKQLWKRILHAGLVTHEQMQRIHKQVRSKTLQVKSEDYATQKFFGFIRERFPPGRDARLDQAIGTKNVSFVFNFIKQVDKPTYEECAKLFDREKKRYIMEKTSSAKAAGSTAARTSQHQPTKADVHKQAIIVLLRIVKQKLPMYYKEVALSIDKNRTDPSDMLQKLVMKVKGYDHEGVVIPYFMGKYKELSASYKQQNQQRSAHLSQQPQQRAQQSFSSRNSTGALNGRPNEPARATLSNKVNYTSVTQQNAKPPAAAVTNSVKQVPTVAQKRTNATLAKIASTQTGRFVTGHQLDTLLPQVTRARNYSFNSSPSSKQDILDAQRMQGVTLTVESATSMANYLDSAIEELLRRTLADLVQLSNHRKNGLKRRIESTGPAKDSLVPQIEHLNRLSQVEHQIAKERKVLDLLKEAQRTQGQKQRRTGMTKAGKARMELKNNLLKRETEKPGSVAEDVENKVNTLMTTYKKQEEAAARKWQGRGSALFPKHVIKARDLQTFFAGSSNPAVTWKSAIGERIGCDVTLAKTD